MIHKVTVCLVNRPLDFNILLESCVLKTSLFKWYDLNLLSLPLLILEMKSSQIMTIFGNSQ